MKKPNLFCFISIIGVVLLLYGCDGITSQRLEFSTDYQAVFMDNGQVFFGRVEKAGSKYPLMREVYYVDSRIDKESKKVTNVLVKRGNEWHAPDFMYINSRHIVLIEPVAQSSRVAQLIFDSKAKDSQ